MECNVMLRHLIWSSDLSWNLLWVWQSLLYYSADLVIVQHSNKLAIRHLFCL